MKIISPQDNRLQNELSVNVVVEIKKGSSDKIKMLSPEEQVDINVSKTTECKSLSLKLGENRISIRSFKNGVLVDEKVRYIYVTSLLHHQYKYPPKKYTQSYFHSKNNEAKCSKCHDMRVNEVKNVVFVDIKKSNCYTCHKSIAKEKYAHAPAANWLCTSCHKIEIKDRTKYASEEPVNKLCLDCHKENRELWNSSKYRHEPLDSGHCNKCHNPHSSPNPMFVRKPVNQICMGCHKDKHIKASQGGSSMCSGINKGDLCITCHNPHASNRPFFLKKIINKEKK